MCRAELAWRLPPRLRRWRCEAINRDLAAGARGYVKALRMKRWRENRPSNCPAWISCSCGRAIQSNSASIASGAMPSTRLLTTSVRCSPSSGRPVPGSRAITRQAEMLQPGVNDIDTPVAVALRRSVGHEPLVAPPAGLQRDRGHRHVYRRRAPGTHGGCPDHRAHRDGPSVPVQAGGGSRVGHACRRLFRILRAGASKIASEHFSQRDQSRLPLYTMGRSEGSVTPES